MVSLSQIACSYDNGKSFAVRDLSLHVEPGEFVILIGQSGCGKTTTLKAINRLIELTSGTIEIDGQNTSSINPVELRRSIGYVFQGIGLFPHLSVAENVGAVPRLLGWDASRAREKSAEMLTMVGMEPQTFQDRMPSELSGGQRQRVGVARALAASQKIVLMDEPFGALDPITRDQLQTEFSTLQKRLGITVVMVTHDMTEALLMADRIAVMDNGSIVQVGTPHQLITQPSHHVVKELMATPRRQTEQLERLLDEGDSADD